MELGWAAAIQAAIMAISTLIVRAGAKRDKAEVKHSAATPSDVDAVKREVIRLREDFEILRSAYFKQNPVVDHRGPTKSKE